MGGARQTAKIAVSEGCFATIWRRVGRARMEVHDAAGGDARLEALQNKMACMTDSNVAASLVHVVRAKGGWDWLVKQTKPHVAGLLPNINVQFVKSLETAIASVNDDGKVFAFADIDGSEEVIKSKRGTHNTSTAPLPKEVSDVSADYDAYTTYELSPETEALRGTFSRELPCSATKRGAIINRELSLFA
jgi:hypothetical protein